jgi:hypothetical protein
MLTGSVAGGYIAQITNLAGSIRYGLRNPPVRWVMLASIVLDGVSIYAFIGARDGDARWRHCHRCRWIRPEVLAGDRAVHVVGSSSRR